LTLPTLSMPGSITFKGIATAGPPPRL
jgi:hypothetical protein